jgi:hypothetical protein
MKKKPKQITKNAIVQLLRTRLHKSGVMLMGEQKEGEERGKKRKAVAADHGFRKFVTTNFIRTRLNYTFVKNYFQSLTFVKTFQKDLIAQNY